MNFYISTLLSFLQLSPQYSRHRLLFFHYVFLGHTVPHAGSWFPLALPALEAQILNHWTAREVLMQFNF